MRNAFACTVLISIAPALAAPMVGGESVEGMWELDLVAVRTDPAHAGLTQNEHATTLIEQSAGVIWEFVDNDTFRLHFGQSAELPMKLEQIDGESSSFAFGPGVEAGRQITLVRTGAGTMRAVHHAVAGEGEDIALPYLRRIDPASPASPERAAELRELATGEWRIERARFDDPAIAPLVHEAVRMSSEADLARFSIVITEGQFGQARSAYEVLAAGTDTLAIGVEDGPGRAIHFLEFVDDDRVNMYAGRHALPLKRAKDGGEGSR